MENNGLDIVSGVFYTRMEKYYEGSGDNADTIFTHSMTEIAPITQKTKAECKPGFIDES